LNTLHEENQALKQNCQNYHWYKQYKQLLNENEQLKQWNQCLAEKRHQELEDFE
jgi:hypothetical protein